ncbi:hypothetical protein P9239_07890 [Caballeronia sp. LZ062]|uniref:hypothetical protein n=1 Tax=unclassified Caballeronia TaxID=2646786 RepID=UPI00285A51B3|nr:MULTISPECIES: hypothetical protein [unclassified Caballeronia]MDR5855194.1 hypothetical protein [Caballeronia sp. LZ050]MDR5870276.1 hypothetical protein [Caballeronia sp. LZ062]
MRERNSTPWTLVIAVFIASFGLLALRNLDPLTFPTVYAEDGVWSGQILANGFMQTAFHGREFPIFGVVLLDQCALWLCKLLPGGLLRLPLALFIVCNAFLAICACAVLLSLRRRLPLLIRVGMWLALLLMPVGNDGNEIFGRALNMGFVFPVLQAFLLAAMLSDMASARTSIVALLVALIAGWTFPVSIAINAVAVAALCSRDRQRLRIRLPWQGWTLLAVIAANAAALQVASITSKGGANLPWVPAGFVEFALARTLLFPLVSLVYRHLNDTVVIVLCLGVFGSLIALLVRLRHSTPADRRIVSLLVGSFVVYAAATIVMRIGFTSLLSGSYRATFPDRYFYGLNVLGTCAVLVTVAMLARTPRAWRRTASFWLVLVLIAPLVNHRVVELHRPATQWREHGTFQASLCDSADRLTSSGSGAPSRSLTSVDTYPKLADGSYWQMQVPTSFLVELASSGRCARPHDALGGILPSGPDQRR